MSQSHNKTNNDKLIIGIVVGLFVGVLTFYASSFITKFSEQLLIILVTTIVIFTLLFLILLWYRKKIIKKLFGQDIEFHTVVDDTQEAINLISNEVTDRLPIEEDQKTKIKTFAPKLVNYLIWSRFRNWGLKVIATFIIGLGGIVSSTLIFNQNKLFEIQNKRIDQQTNLIEADRRSGQMFVLGEVLSDVNSELDKGVDTLSQTLVGRIISLSYGMKPYKYLLNDSLVQKPTSIERAQLLLALVSSGINKKFLHDEILVKSRFEYSELNLADPLLDNKDLSFINLNYATFSGTRINGVRFVSAKLKEASFDSAFVDSVDFSKANLYNADLSGIRGGLDGVNFCDANLLKTNFSGLKLAGANFEGAMLDYTNFEGADFTGVKSLHRARVESKDWLVNLDDTVKGVDAIKNDYEVVSEFNIGMNKNIYHLVKKGTKHK